MRRAAYRSLAMVVCVGFAGASLVTTAAADSTDPIEALVDYSFVEPPADAMTVENLADGSSFGPAIVHNGSSALWKDSALSLTGGDKETTPWVELPQDLLQGIPEMTVVTEVRPASNSLDRFNFMWNIGSADNAEYAFVSLNCANNRNPLVGIKVGGAETLVQADSCVVNANEWTSIAATFAFTGSDYQAALYVNGSQVAVGSVPAGPDQVGEQSLNTIGRSPWPDPNFAGDISTFRIYPQPLSAEQILDLSNGDAMIHSDSIREMVATRMTELGIVDQRISQSAIALPTDNNTISWQSSNPAVISTQGEVTLPSSGEEAVTLTATKTVRGITVSKDIVVIVEADLRSEIERLEEKASAYVIGPMLVDGSALPVPPRGLELRSVVAEGLELEQGIVVGSENTHQGVITAELALVGGEQVVSKTFDVTVLGGEGIEELVAYHRTPTSVQEANNGDIAYSAHLALRPVGKDTWTPLNENYGIFFPTMVGQLGPNSDTNVAMIRSLKDPAIFDLAEGGYGLVATRTDRGDRGGPDPDGSQKDSVLLAVSEDLLDFTEIGLVKVSDGGGVNQPYAVYDSASKKYVIAWEDDGGVAKYTTFDDLKHPGTQSIVSYGEVPRNAQVDSAEGIEDFNPGTAVYVDKEQSEKLAVRYGRITNTGYEPLKQLSLGIGQEIDQEQLPQRVDLAYSDGSTGSLAIDSWDFSAVDTQTPGEYTATGTVKQTEYPVPFADDRADPSIFHYDWNGEDLYLMIATHDENDDVINHQGRGRMPLRVASSISALSDQAQGGSYADVKSKEIELLSRERGDTDWEGKAMTGCFWAPELHIIEDRLSVLFMPCYGSTPDMWSGRASIMQLEKNADGTDKDPADPGNWSKPQAVTRADGRPLNVASGISLDMTYFQDEKGQSYYAWQQLGSIFIATVDPMIDPYKITSEPVRIVVPEYAWDNKIAEGPNVTLRDGKFYMLYSGSEVGNSYTTGLAIADASGNTDLSDPHAWKKLNYPIQKSGIYNGDWQLGTGHGMWSEDEDQNMIYVFHAKTNHNDLRGRDTFVRRVHWASDGMPVLDMEMSEELAEPTVSLSVKVLGADKSWLSQLLEQAEVLNPTDYTAQSWATLLVAWDLAQTVFDNETSSQEAVNAAAAGLAEAIRGLQGHPSPTVVDKEGLANAIFTAEKLRESNYSSETWRVFAQALAAARTVYSDSEVDQQQVDAATQNLTQAMEALQPVDSDLEITSESEDPISGGILATTGAQTMGLVVVGAVLMLVGAVILRKRKNAQ